MKIFFAALFALISTAICAECTLSQLSSISCPTASSSETSTTCNAKAGCTWCATTAEQSPVCKVKNGVCTCTPGTASGGCFSSSLPTCDFTVPASGTEEGKDCNPPLVLHLVKDTCPTVDGYPTTPVVPKECTDSELNDLECPFTYSEESCSTEPACRWCEDPSPFTCVGEGGKCVCRAERREGLCFKKQGPSCFVPGKPSSPIRNGEPCTPDVRTNYTSGMCPSSSTITLAADLPEPEGADAYDTCREYDAYNFFCDANNEADCKTANCLWCSDTSPMSCIGKSSQCVCSATTSPSDGICISKKTTKCQLKREASSVTEKAPCAPAYSVFFAPGKCPSDKPHPVEKTATTSSSTQGIMIAVLAAITFFIVTMITM